MMRTIQNDNYEKNRRNKVNHYNKKKNNNAKKIKKGFINNNNKKNTNPKPIKKNILNNNKNDNSNKNILIIFITLICVFVIALGVVFILENNDNEYKGYSNNNKKEIKINYLDYYYPNVITNKDKKIYILESDNFKEIGVVSSNIKLSLIKDEYVDKGYFKIKDTDYYIDYYDIKESDEEIEDLFWKNYIPFNESIKTNEITNLYKDNKLILSINDSLTLPIIIKKDKYYGVIFKDKLYYVLKDECEVIKSNNTDLKHTKSVAALTYHFVYDSSNNEEKNKCMKMNSTICLSDKQLESHFKYLKEKNFYTASMKDIEMFVDGEIQLPEHTVLITIDDGNFVSASIKMLEKYNFHGTLFLIGIAGSPENYKSDNLEIHSHTWDMHKGGICKGGQGSEIKCLPKEEIQADLKKSRESLNNTTYFCWPFFEYNDYAIENLKEAGFTMAFIGGRKKITPGMNKLLLPRYGIINTTTVSEIAQFVS